MTHTIKRCPRCGKAVNTSQSRGRPPWVCCRDCKDADPAWFEAYTKGKRIA